MDTDLGTVLLFFEINTDPVAVANANGRILTSNSKMKRFLDRSDCFTDAIMACVQNRVTEDEVEFSSGTASSSLFETPPRRTFSVSVRSAGNLFWATVRPSPEYCCVKKKLTAIRAMLELCPSGVALSHLDCRSGQNRYRYVSQKFCALSGAKEKDLLTHGVAAIVPRVAESDWKQLEPLIIRALLKMEDFKTKPARLFIDGVYRWRQHHVHVALRSANELSITGMNQSLDRKLECKIFACQLHMLGSLIQASCDVVFRMDKHMRIVDESTAVKAFFEQSVVGRSLETFIICQKDIRTLKEYLANQKHSPLNVQVIIGLQSINQVQLFVVPEGELFIVGLRIITPPPAFNSIKIKPTRPVEAWPYLARRMELDVLHAFSVIHSEYIPMYRVYLPQVYQDAVSLLVSPNVQSEFIQSCLSADLVTCSRLLGANADILNPKCPLLVSGASLLDIWQLLISLLPNIHSGTNAFTSLALLDNTLSKLTAALKTHTVTMLMLQLSMALVSTAIRYSHLARIQPSTVPWLRRKLVDTLTRVSQLIRELPHEKDRCLPIVYYLCSLWIHFVHTTGCRNEWRALTDAVGEELKTYTRRHPENRILSKLVKITFSSNTK